MTTVLGVDSSTQSTKALLVDADDGTVLGQHGAPHPPGTQVDPHAWRLAFDTAAGDLLPQAAALGVAGQQHGMVARDETGEPVRDAILWNDTGSATAAADLIAELGGPQACAEAVGSVLVASFTVTKLRWLRDNEPEAAARVADVLLPHDYVSLHAAAPGTAPFTDRGDASGTGYFSTATDDWRRDLAAAAIGHEIDLPRVVAPGAVAGETSTGVLLSAGTGDNMGAALGLSLEPGDVVLSVGTSGVASAVTDARVCDGTGVVTGFANATGGFLPMVVTMNAAGILDLQAALLGVSHDELSDLALAAPAGAHGLTLLPYYGGERTPNRPSAVGTWSGLTGATTRADLARAGFEALLCSLADAVDELVRHSGHEPRRLMMIGGATASPALRALAPTVLGRAVTFLPAGEYVARGAARQAAWALSGAAEPPAWPLPVGETVEGEPAPGVRERYAELRDRTETWT